VSEKGDNSSSTMQELPVSETNHASSSSMQTQSESDLSDNSSSTMQEPAGSETPGEQTGRLSSSIPSSSHNLIPAAASPTDTSWLCACHNKLQHHCQHAPSHFFM
jgi:hypothetical protein